MLYDAIRFWGSSGLWFWCFLVWFADFGFSGFLDDCFCWVGVIVGLCLFCCFGVFLGFSGFAVALGVGCGLRFVCLGCCVLLAAYCGFVLLA